jgi:hypothetical protein
MIERIRLTSGACSVNGYKCQSTDPAWRDLYLDRAQPRCQASMMLLPPGRSDAPIDTHLSVPWCHRDERRETLEEQAVMECLFRVRPRIEVGSKRGKHRVKSVQFERWPDGWWIALELEPLAMAPAIVRR